jgi:uncharacterized protein YndB with AHSA1/START domain
MSDVSTDHGTVVVERTLNVPVSRAYGAFADAKQRASWGAPSDSAVFIYDETDFALAVAIWLDAVQGKTQDFAWKRATLTSCMSGALYGLRRFAKSISCLQ